MADMIDVDPLGKFMAMIVGPNGGGKSIAIASWMKRGSIYFFDFDGRMASVANWYKQRGLKRGQLQYDTYGPENLYEAVKKLDSFIDRCDHAAIVLDSFTAITVSAVMFSLRRRMNKGPNSGKYPTLTSGDMIVPDWDEYKGETVLVTQMLDLCKAIAAKGVAVFWTAHPVSSTKIEGKTYGIQTRYAAYGQKSDSLLPIYFNEIYHLTTEHDFATDSRRRLCFTQPFLGVNAKTALNLPAQFDWTDGNFYDIFTNLVHEGQVKAEENNKQLEENNNQDPNIETSTSNPF